MFSEAMSMKLKTTLYKKFGNRTFNNTENVAKHINNYSNGITNNYKMDKI